MPEGDNLVAICFDAPLVQLGSEFAMRDLEKLGPEATMAKPGEIEPRERSLVDRRSSE